MSYNIQQIASRPNEKRTIWRRFCGWIYDISPGWLIQLVRNIKSLFRWLPVIWNDRNYDHSFILTILRKKIQMMRDEFQEVKFYVGWEEDVAKMSRAIYLLDRLIAEDYLFEAQDLCFSEDYGEIKFKEHGMEPESVNEENRDKYSGELRDSCEMEEFLHEKDLCELTTLLRDEIRKWWW